LAGGGGTGGSGQIDYTKGTWQLQNVSNSPNAYSRDARLVVAGAELFAAWTDQGPSTADIWAAKIGSTPAQITTTGATSSSLAYSDGQVLLSWVSSDDGDYDIYMGIGPGFSERYNLTTSATDTYTDTEGVLAVGGGVKALAHTRWIGESLVFVRTWTDPTNTKATQIVSGKGSCDEPMNLVADAAGKLHFLTTCPSGINGGNVFYTNNVLGSWLELADIGAGTTGNRNAALAIGPNDTAYAMWRSGLKDLIWTSKGSDGVWTLPKVGLPNVNRAAIGLDGQGRLLVAFDRTETTGETNLYFTWLEANTFATPMPIGPGSSPFTLVFDAGGLPNFVYEKEEVPNQSSSSDIWLAKFVPQ
jgi:hypothetical protein